MSVDKLDNQYSRQNDPGGRLFNLGQEKAGLVYDTENGDQKGSSQINQDIQDNVDTLQKMYDDEKQNLEEYDFLAWEPLKPIQKIQALFSNTLEVTFITVFATFAIHFPSMISVSLLILSLPLLHVQTFYQSKRWCLVACFLVVNQLILGTIVAWKVNVIKTMQIASSDQNAALFTNKLRFYEALGLKVNHNFYVNSSQTSLKFEIQQVNYIESFMIEVIYSILTIVTMVLVCSQMKRVKYLSEVNNKSSVERLQLLIDDPIEKDKEQAHLEELKKELKPVEIRDLQLKETARLKKLTEEFRQLRKEVQVTFVDSYFFFKQDQKFFVLLLLTQLIEAMTFNSCSDIPGLFLIAIMTAFYPIRKSYSVVYRIFCFFVVYLIMTVMLLKIIYEIVSQIKFINLTLQDKKYADYKSVMFINIVFGSQHNASPSDRAFVLVSTFFCFYCCCLWRTAKWIEIRNKTKHARNLSSFGQLRAYFEKRSQEDDLEVRLRQNKKLDPQERSKLIEAAKIRKINCKRSRHVWLASENAAKKSLQDFNKYVPLISLCVTRVNLFCLAYTYHTFGSIFLLIWTLCSFTLPEKFVIFFSAVVVAPIFTVGFFIIYCSKIPVISTTQFFQRPTVRYLAWKMKNPILEQSIMYFTLAIFFMMIIGASVSPKNKKTLQKEDLENSAGSTQVQLEKQENKTQQHSPSKQKVREENELLAFFTKRITNTKFSHNWKILFLLTIYIQTVVLLGVFIMGLSALDQYKSLGFMVFFIIYTAYESVYRKTGFLLIYWISFFILETYIKGLICNDDNVAGNILSFVKTDSILGAILKFWEKLNTKNTIKLNSAKGIFQIKYDICAITPKKDMYFRVHPQLSNWLVLVAMSILCSINKMYNHDQKQMNFLVQECLNGIQGKNEKVCYYLNRVKSIVMGVFIYLALIVMIYLQKNLEVNMINYVFFILNSITLATLIKGEAKAGTLKTSLRLANIIKTYAISINLAQIAFFVLFGDSKFIRLTTAADEDSLDEWLSRTYPNFYRLLPQIGFRQLDDNEEEDLLKAQKHKFYIMYSTYVVFFLLSLNLIWHFERALKNTESDAKFDEFHYKRIFEFRTKEQQDMEKERGNRNCDPNVKVYEQKDFVNLYEQTRFSLPFMVYRAIDHWPIFDFIATYGHIIQNLAVVYLATQLNVNFYMFFNVCCVCYFYSVATIKLSHRADKLTTVAGLQRQIDLRTASIVSQDYQKQSSYEFLKLRRKIWYIQFIALLIVVWVGFPTELLYYYRKKHMDKDLHSKPNISPQDYDGLPQGETLKFIDDTSFWLFFFGLYKDAQHELINGKREYANKSTYWITICTLLVGLIFERQSINWLKNRFGCTHYKLQKFIELDMRRESLRKNKNGVIWEVCPPVYDIERYRQHYFDNDFDELKKKFIVNSQAEANKKNKKDSGEIGDFVPYEKAVMIRETIKFSIFIDGGCSLAKQDKQAKELLGSQQVKISTVIPDQIELIFSLVYTQKVPAGYSLFVVGDIVSESLGEINSEKLQEVPCLIKDKMSPCGRDGDIWEYKCVILGEGGVVRAGMEGLKVKQKKHKGLPLLAYKYCLVETETGKITWESAFNKWQNVQVEEAQEYPGDYHGKAQVFDSWQAGTVQPYNYESVPLLRAFKLQQLQRMLTVAVDFKYQISFLKGLKYVFENLVLLLLMISIIVKSNLYSILYLIFVFRFVVMKNKDRLIIKANAYMAFFFAFQYFLYLINLSAKSSPQQFPRGFRNYPRNVDQQQPFVEDDISIRFSVPVFLHFEQFRDFQISFLLGIGLDQLQLSNLILDFVNLYLISMYILTFRNPIYDSKVHKVFWQYPTPADSKQWKRLDAIVQRAVLWLYNPIKLEATKDHQILSQLVPAQVDLAEAQHRFAMKYCTLNKYDLNYHLKTYVDLKSDVIWSEANLRAKKYYLKVNCTYYRLVKSGSKFVYLTLHVFSIFAILLMSILRKSLISVVYVLLLVPKLKAAAQVLDQRQINANSLRESYKNRQAKLIAKQAKLKPYQKEYKDIAVELVKIDENLQNLAQSSLALSHIQKQGQRNKSKVKKWPILAIMQIYVLAYSILDFTCNTVAQLPIIAAEDIQNSFIRHFVTGKIWDLESNELQSYEHWIINTGRSEKSLSMRFDRIAVQCLICFTIFLVVLQSDIFNSSGYSKFVTEIGGSLDGIMKLSDDRAKIITWIFNNHKIKKIMSLQKKRETIMATVERVREKLINWGKFTAQKLDNDDHGLQKSHQIIINRIKQDQNESEEINQTLIVNKYNSKQYQSKSTEAEAANSVQTYQIEQKRRALDLNPEQMEEILDEIAHQFTQSKMKKMRASVRFYQWLNIKFTEQIMFKSSKEDLQEIKLEVAEGGTSIYTELEDIMWVESRELVREQYCDLEGRRELAILLEKKQNMNVNDIPADFLLQYTKIDKKIKLKNMPRTWKFTRPLAMALRLAETFIYICVSNTHSLIYLSMIFSMFSNAGLLSLFYPIMVFGKGMLNESRPSKKFWETIRNYNVFLLVIKLIGGMKITFELFEVKDKQYIDLLGFLKLGAGLGIVKDTTSGIFLKVLPEVLILCFIMFNEIKLKILGLYYKNEEDIEKLPDGISRVELEGDERAVSQKRLEDSKMFLSRYFESVEEQRRRQNEAIQDCKEEIKQKLRNKKEIDLQREYGIVDRVKIAHNQFLKEHNDERSLKEKQQQLLCSISKSIKETSKEFDLDGLATANFDTPWDYCISQNALQKTLDSDEVIFVEGERRLQQPEFLTAEEFRDELLLADNCDVWSACDHDQEFTEKFEAIAHEQKPKNGYFENSEYFSSIFPSSKIQKPGYDFYGPSTLVLGLIALFIFYCFPYYTVDPGIFPWIAGQSQIFEMDFALTLLFIIVIMIIERYANRTDTMETRAKVDIMDTSRTENKTRFFSDEEIFKKSQKYKQQMTIRARTALKTKDFNIKGESEQMFLKKLQTNHQSGQAASQQQQLITSQQKTKYIMHWFVLILGHFYVFWFIPISSNMQLYKAPICGSEKRENKCYDFEENIPLQILYILIVIYLCLSSFQLRYGFPTLKKPSSVLSNYNNIQQVGAQLYAAIPFAVELRCLLDFTFTKTSLDLFQFFQLWQYHYEMYNAKISSNYYAHVKVLGSKQHPCDKCIFGILISFIMMGLMAGPFLLFSEYGGLIAPNPVLTADFQMSLLINSTYYMAKNASSGDELILKPFDVADNDLYTNYNAQNISNQYSIFANGHMFINNFTESQWKNSSASKQPEVKFFEADQVQALEGSAYSDSTWLITRGLKRQLFEDIDIAANTKSNSRFRNVTLQLEMRLRRDQPDTSKVVPVQMRRDLDYQNISDCITGLQLKEIKNLNCYGKNKDRKFVIFRKAFMQEMVLGQTTFANLINVKKEHDTNWQDVLLEISCGQSWIVRARQTNTQPYSTYLANGGKYNKTDDFESQFWNQTVNPETCLPQKQINESTMDKISSQPSIQEILQQKAKQFEEETQANSWESICFYAFSMLVSTSFLASMTPMTFYTAFLVGIQPTIRSILVYNTNKSSVYDVVDPDCVIRLVEACYIYRHECDLAGEEEVYRMIIEILKTPEFYKAIQGTSLKGTTDPALDFLQEDQKAKYLTLEKLEQKGFDVGILKKNLISRSNNQGEKEVDSGRIRVYIYP